MTEQQQTTPGQSTQSQPSGKKQNYLIEDETKLAALCYAAIGFFIPLLTKPNNEKLLFHIKQGIVLFGGWIVILIVLVIMPLLGLLLFLAYFGLNVIALFRAYNGETWKIPVIGDFAERLPLGTAAKSSGQTQNQAQSEEKTEKTEQPGMKEEENNKKS